MNAESKTVVLHNFSEVLHEDGVDIPLISTEEQSFILSNSSVDRRYQNALHKISPIVKLS